MPPLPPTFIFPSAPLKILSFSHIPPFQKNDDLKLIHRWIIVKFEHQICHSILNIIIIENFENILELREKPFLLQLFLFPKKPKTVLVKLRSQTR